jgi:L-ascorbate metabolism protein UlaG (beta-lactamase superfamily)
MLLLALIGARSQELPKFAPPQKATNAEILLQLVSVAGLRYQIETSTNLTDWQTMLTLLSTGQNQQSDSGAPFSSLRYYRAREVTNGITGDHLPTGTGDVVFHPVNHASLVMTWNDLAIYNDPVGGSAPYQGLPRADLILVSHSHGDHFNSATIDAVKRTNTVIIAPQAVYNSLSASSRTQTVVLVNGASTTALGIQVEAIPAYNLTTANHSRGAGNGYVITLGNRRIYVSGDTEDIPEMRALQGIDVAFLCMNVPFTMSVTKAASAIRQFQPRIVYPYHYRNQDSTLADLNSLRRQVGTDLGIEIRTRKWY